MQGDTAVVGAICDDDPCRDGELCDTGSVYVFRFNGKTWNEVQKLVASDAVIGDRFGHQVALSGDTALVSAFSDDGAGSGSGSAYAFRYDPTTLLWNEVAKLKSSDAAAQDVFGISLAVSVDRAIIGAYWDDDNGNRSGSAYYFAGFSDCNDNDTVDLCDIADGQSDDVNGNGIPDECEAPCPWDLDGSGDVGVKDLLILLGEWGPNPGHPADFDGGGEVRVEDLLSLLGDGGPVRVVVTNRGRNALDAMPDCGALTIATALEDGFSLVTFTDTCTRIPCENLDKIFDTLFTTKIHATGLGLAACQQIISRHNGTIEVVSEPGKETTFTVRLPLNEETGPPPSTSVLAIGARPGTASL